MREIPHEKIIAYGIGIVLVAIATPILHRFPRTRGRNIFGHLAFVIATVCTIIFVPDYVQKEIFSPGGVLVVGTLLPVYESIVAVCSIGEADDTVWLQFWITSASLSFSTEFMDSITEYLPNAGEHWYEFEFFFNLWLILPFTDGATLIYDKFTKKFIGPIAAKINKLFEGWIAYFMTAVNTSYLWFVWWAFMTLPEEARRFIVVMLGTVYPMAASTVSIATEDTGLDDTMWLTYWSTFSLLFVMMDYLENFVGHIRGFYSLIAVATVYLFLPMFKGAEVVFRNVLVPLSGQYENLLLHDAYLVKNGMLENIPEKERERVLMKTANIFAKTTTTKKTN